MRRLAFLAALLLGCATPGARDAEEPEEAGAALARLEPLWSAPAAPAAAPKETAAPAHPEPLWSAPAADASASSGASAAPAAAPAAAAKENTAAKETAAPREVAAPSRTESRRSTREEAQAANALALKAAEKLKARDFDGCLRALREAIALDPRLGRLAPGETARRLEGILSDIGWKQPARRAALAPGAADKDRAQAADAASAAIVAFAEGRDVEAMLNSAAAVGADPQAAAFRALNDGLSARTGLVTPLDELLPRTALVQLKLQRSERAFLDERYGEAARDAQQAAWLEPRNVLAWTRLGSARWATGETERAVQAFHSALALDPENAEVRAFLASKSLPLPPPRSSAPAKTVDINSQ